MMTDTTTEGADLIYVTDLRPADVLFGRGSGPNDHEGNVRFRQLVAERKAEYMATNHRMTKAKIAKEIVDQVFAENGRFLKKIELHEGDVYEIADEETIMEKAKQALRQNAGKIKQDPEVRARSKTPPRKAAPATPVNLSQMPPPPQSFPIQNIRSATYDDLEPIPVVQSSFPIPYQIQSSAPKGEAVSSIPAGLPSSSTIPSWQDTKFSSNATAAGLARGNGPVHHHQQQDVMVGRHPYHRPPPEEEEEDEDAGMLSYLRSSAFANAGISNDLSMAHIPQEERRGSITMTDRRGSLQMSDLMDSFSKMKAVEDSRKTFYASTETMGTIEPIGTGSLADMSLGSTFSFLRGNDSIASPDDRLDDRPSPASAERDNLTGPALHPYSKDGSMASASALSIGTISSAARFMQSDTSLSHLDFWSSRRKSSASSNISDISYMDVRNSLVGQPRALGLMEEEPDNLEFDEMGKSSLSVLKAFTSTSNFDLPAEPSPLPEIRPYQVMQQQQEFQQQQQQQQEQQHLQQEQQLLQQEQQLLQQQQHQLLQQQQQQQQLQQRRFGGQ